MKLPCLRRPKPIIQQLHDLKEEYEIELEKLKQKVSDFDTTVLMHENQKLREENKQLKEKIKIYEQFSPRIIDGRNPYKEIGNEKYTLEHINQDVRYTKE